ncbi:MAG TPA: SDR family oxidoreductase [Thermomicrobiaceae bacterium]|nr:SDR family oxidoreductase [Thermomicrobiaceae bacterium]
MRLQGKVALITGGTSGIGRAMVELFAREGALVTLTGRARAAGRAIGEAIATSGGEARFVPLDVRRLDELRQVIAATAERHGRLDVQVNNAGAVLPKSLLETSEDEFDLIFDTNVKPVFFGTRWAAEIMLRQGGGSIVNTASTSGLRGQRERAAYCGSKGAVIQITRAAALDLAAYQVRVNCVSPGAIDTPLLRAARFGAQANQDELVAQVGRGLPLGRIGSPTDIALAALYLASDESEWVTGTNIVVDGGGTA